MGKLELIKESPLTLYCFSVKQRDFSGTPLKQPLPLLAQFFLGYNVQELFQRVAFDFGGSNLDAMIHAQQPFDQILDLVNLPQAITMPITQTPEYNKMQFIRGLRLVVDKYCDPQDRVALESILAKVKVDEPLNKNL